MRTRAPKILKPTKKPKMRKLTPKVQPIQIIPAPTMKPEMLPPIRTTIPEMPAPIPAPKTPIINYLPTPKVQTQPTPTHLERSSPLMDAWRIISAKEEESANKITTSHDNDRSGSSVTNCLLFLLLWSMNQGEALQIFSGKMTKQAASQHEKKEYNYARAQLHNKITTAQHHYIIERRNSTIVPQQSSTMREQRNNTHA